jgi:gp16 family phage-associated protein
MRADSVALKPTVTNRSARCGVDTDRIVAARRKLSAMDMSIREWCEANGYVQHYGLVRAILNGRKACNRGISSEIAVKLGLKDSVLSDG